MPYSMDLAMKDIMSLCINVRVASMQRHMMIGAQKHDIGTHIRGPIETMAVDIIGPPTHNTRLRWQELGSSTPLFTSASIAKLVMPSRRYELLATFGTLFRAIPIDKFAIGKPLLKFGMIISLIAQACLAFLTRSLFRSLQNIWVATGRALVALTEMSPFREPSLLFSGTGHFCVSCRLTRLTANAPKITTEKRSVALYTNTWPTTRHASPHCSIGCIVA